MSFSSHSYAYNRELLDFSDSEFSTSFFLRAISLARERPPNPVPVCYAFRSVSSSPGVSLAGSDAADRIKTKTEGKKHASRDIHGRALDKEEREAHWTREKEFLFRLLCPLWKCLITLEWSECANQDRRGELEIWEAGGGVSEERIGGWGGDLGVNSGGEDGVGCCWGWCGKIVVFLFSKVKDLVFEADFLWWWEMVNDLIPKRLIL